MRSLPPRGRTRGREAGAPYASGTYRPMSPARRAVRRLGGIRFGSIHLRRQRRDALRRASARASSRVCRSSSLSQNASRMPRYRPSYGGSNRGPIMTRLEVSEGVLDKEARMPPLKTNKRIVAG